MMSVLSWLGVFAVVVVLFVVAWLFHYSVVWLHDQTFTRYKQTTASTPKNMFARMFK